MKRALFAACAALCLVSSWSSWGCAKNLDELAPFPCAEDASCPDDFTCLPRAAVGDDSCFAANDGVCDEPETCDAFTDTSDCAQLGQDDGVPVGDDSCQFAFDGACDDPQFCPPNTDATDCANSGDTTGADSCTYANDGACDEPVLCSAGTDGSDCRARSFCVADDAADDARCEVDADCGEGRCEGGLCVAGEEPIEECDLFENECGAGVCAATGSDAAGYVATCVDFPPQQLPPGSNCTDNGPSCGPATACYGDPTNGFFCFLLCDDAHACPFGSCNFFAGESFGRCV